MSQKPSETSRRATSPLYNMCEMENCRSDDSRALSHCQRCKRFACTDCYEQFVERYLVPKKYRGARDSPVHVCIECRDEMTQERAAALKKLESKLACEEDHLADERHQEVRNRLQLFVARSRLRDMSERIVLLKSHEKLLAVATNRREKKIENTKKKIAELIDDGADEMSGERKRRRL